MKHDMTKCIVSLINQNHVCIINKLKSATNSIFFFKNDVMCRRHSALVTVGVSQGRRPTFFFQTEEVWFIVRSRLSFPIRLWLCPLGLPKMINGSSSNNDVASFFFFFSYVLQNGPKIHHQHQKEELQTPPEDQAEFFASQLTLGFDRLQNMIWNLKILLSTF